MHLDPVERDDGVDRAAGAAPSSGTRVLYVSIVVGNRRFKMGNTTSEAIEGDELTLTVDDRGRVTLPKEVRNRLGIESNDEIPATLVGSVLEVNPKPSSKLETATAGRESWEHTTPTDAGETLFGPMDQ
jgi:AbrB family looped-hinge helix DNA binding protein